MALKVRANLSSAEAEALTDLLMRKLDAMVIETQPEVAARLLELVANPDAGLSDFAGVIRNDTALSGRLLRMSNSAFFAQREPVTTLERATVLLGINRIRALALGFYMSRAIDSGGEKRYGRIMWGKSLLRACLAAKIAEAIRPNLYAEAFLIGLMMDAGVPLARTMIGPEAYDRACPASQTPSRGYKAEQETFTYTHVDIARALIRRWRVPDVLAKPILWHHSPPQSLSNTEPIHLLHRISFYVGAMHVEHEPPSAMAVPLPTLGQKLLGMDPRKLAEVFKSACKEYATVREFFGHVADGLTDIESLGQRVHGALNRLIEQSMEDQIKQESSMSAGIFRFHAGTIEVLLDDAHAEFAVAYIIDASGNRQAVHRFPVGSATAADVLMELSLSRDDLDSAELENMTDYLRALAA
ncbi:MAG: HDOD domain-containing protein [Phycisphaeraceae bacterium]|nr:HDOD domain-containing protein [Phycisphaeraceae bacterium]